MPSIALQVWQTRGKQALDEVEAAHAAVGGAGRGRRYATQQINQAYVVLLCSQFQRFSRDLHDESADYLARQPAYRSISPILSRCLTSGRRLDSGNASPQNLAADFDRFGVEFWRLVQQRDHRNSARRERLEMMNRWRNAIAHQDFRSPLLGGRDSLRLAEVRRWRTTCECLAVDFDTVLRVHLGSVTGVAPW